ncbi:MAG: YggT family protein [Ktedonobacterales bacterium]
MQTGVVHLLAQAFFGVLTIFLFIRVICSWIPVGVENPIIRFFTNVTDPILLPIQRRLPHMVVWIMDVSMLIAFVFVWWIIGVALFLILYSLPPNW